MPDTLTAGEHTQLAETYLDVAQALPPTRDPLEPLALALIAIGHALLGRLTPVGAGVVKAECGPCGQKVDVTAAGCCPRCGARLVAF
jgi:hypothetical protein